MPEQEQTFLLFETEIDRLKDDGVKDKKGMLMEGGYTKVTFVIADQWMLERAAKLRHERPLFMDTTLPSTGKRSRS